MTDAAFLELLAGYEAAIEASHRSLTIAQTFADAHRAGKRLPDAVVDAYCGTVERDRAQLVQLREKVQTFKSWFRVH